MKYFSHLLLLVLCLTGLTACDSGDIEEATHTIADSGKTVKLTARLQGVSSWASSNYNVTLAGFSDESKFAVMQRIIPSTLADGQEITMVLNNVSSSVHTVELGITNSLRKRIITLSSLDMNDYEGYAPTDTIHMDLGSMDVDMFGCMQYGIFNVACVQCHGGNGRSAAGLNLTNGMAYDQLVGVPSSKKEGWYRVVSGDPEHSLLRVILHEGGEDILHYNHTEVLSSQFKTNLDEVQDLIDEWIKKLP